MKKLWKIFTKNDKDTTYECCVVMAETEREAWAKTDGVMCFTRKHYTIEEVKEEFVYYIE